MPPCPQAALCPAGTCAGPRPGLAGSRAVHSPPHCAAAWAGGQEPSIPLSRDLGLRSDTRHQLLLNTHSFPQAQYFSSYFSCHVFLLSLVHILVLSKPKRNEANCSKPKADSRMSEFQKQHTVFTHFYFPRPLTQYNSIPLSQLTCSRPHRNKHRAQVNLQTTH